MGWINLLTCYFWLQYSIHNNCPIKLVDGNTFGMEILSEGAFRVSMQAASFFCVTPLRCVELEIYVLLHPYLEVGHEGALVEGIGKLTELSDDGDSLGHGQE